MPQLVGSIASYPARSTFLWFLGLILCGSFLLSQPFAQVQGPGHAPVGYLDAIFTATSAACVTGLTVRSTAHDFSWAGQLIIVVLIQLGGIGIMTITTLIVIQFSGAGLKHKALVSSTLGADVATDLRSILRSVLLFTFVVEFSGFAGLAIRNLFDQRWADALWHALFHSVSAFCNAGFSLYDNNLINYRHDPWVNAVICGLIMTGGLGFPVMLDVRRNWKRKSWLDLWDHLQLNSKIMLLGSTFLWLSGMLCFLAIEWDGVLRGRSLWESLQVSFFQSVTCRTAGFNTVNMGRLTNAILFVMILLMLVGAGPCSTGGGFKVTTAVTLVLRAWSAFRGHGRVSIFRRTIPRDLVERASVTAMLYGAVACLGLTILLLYEQSDRRAPARQDHFLAAAFEVVSALGTVGLSTGITPDLSIPGRLVIICLMFLGRLGPISAFAALSRPAQREVVEYSSEEPLIG